MNPMALVTSPLVLRPLATIRQLWWAPAATPSPHLGAPILASSCKRDCKLNESSFPPEEILKNPFLLVGKT